MGKYTEQITSVKTTIKALESLLSVMEDAERNDTDINISSDLLEMLFSGTSNKPVGSVPNNSVISTVVGNARVAVGTVRKFKVLKDSVIPDTLSPSIVNKRIHKIHNILCRYSNCDNVLTQDVEIDAPPSALCTALIGTSIVNGRRKLEKLLI